MECFELTIANRFEYLKSIDDLSIDAEVNSQCNIVDIVDPSNFVSLVHDRKIGNHIQECVIASVSHFENFIDIDVNRVVEYGVREVNDKQILDANASDDWIVSCGYLDNDWMHEVSSISCDTHIIRN